MRDQYAGDVSDVLKFAFLRALVGTDRTLGIAWYYVPGDDGRADGRHLEWRHKPAWQQLDAQLYAGLSILPVRSIVALESAAIWPIGTLFHREPIPSPVMRSFDFCEGRDGRSSSSPFRGEACLTMLSGDA